MSRFRIAAVGLVLTVAALIVIVTPARQATADPPADPPEATEAEVRKTCGHCHAFPPADTFPRAHWRKEVTQGIDFFHREPSYRFIPPPLEAITRFYERRAPEALAAQPPSPSAGTPRCRFEEQELPPAPGPSGGVNVTTARLFGNARPDVIVCDVFAKQVLVYSPYESPPVWRVIARGVTAAHAEVVDLNGDGILDIVLAGLGRFPATDDRVGSVIWLRGSADKTFTPITLADGLGRVADVRAADFTGDGKLDLVVAEFGWHQTGGIHLLEQKPAADPQRPAFELKPLDARHGPTHVPVADLNRDGRPDFVAVISQEHETVVAFLNEGDGRFRKETIYTAPHPAYGLNGATLADLDGDGDLDVVLTNGDPLDEPYLLRPDHGVQWLENKGAYPFTPHRLAYAYGAVSPEVADFDGDGRLDVVFTAFLPGELFPQREGLNLPAIVVLEQQSPGAFARNVLSVGGCDFPSAVASDVDGDGKADVLVARYSRTGKPGRVLGVWRNRTVK